MRKRMLRKLGFKIYLPFLYLVLVLLMLPWVYLAKIGLLPDFSGPNGFFGFPDGLLILTSLPTLFVASLFKFDFLTNKSNMVMLLGLAATVPFYFLFGLLVDLFISFFRLILRFWNSLEWKF